MALTPVLLVQFPELSEESTYVYRFLYLVPTFLLIPLTGLLVLLLAALPTLLGRQYAREGFRFHAFNVFTAVLLLAILTGLSGMLALWEGAYSTWSFVVGGLAVLTVHLVVLRRYLAFDLTRATAGALVLSLVYIYLWYISVEAHISQTLTFIDLLYTTFPLLILVYIALLLFEAYQNHTIEGKAWRSGTQTLREVPDRRERRLRLGEMWVISSAGAIFILLAFAA